MEPNNQADTPVSTGPLTVSAAASRIEALLDAENAPPAPKEPPKAQAGETPEQADQSGDETPPANDEADESAAGEEAEGEAGEEGAADADEAAGADPLDALYTVKIDGKDEQVPLREALKGYQRQADYSRKTEALANERNTFESDRQAVQAERAQYADLLQSLAAQLDSLQPQQPDWQKLYDQNPLEYVRQKDLWRELQDRRQLVAAEQERVQGQQAQEQSAAVRKMVDEGRTKLKDAIPAWKDQAVYDADRTKLKAYGQKLGFSEQELGMAYDYRAVVALYKAMKYDELAAARPKPAPASAPRVLKPGAPAATPVKGTSELTRAKQRLAQTGRVQDAAQVFESLF